MAGPGRPKKIEINGSIESEPIEPTEGHGFIESLKMTGIPVKAAFFHRTVLSMSVAGGTPEHALYDGGTDKKSRLAKMWYTPSGLLIEQKGLYKMVPLANVSDTNLK